MALELEDFTYEDKAGYHRLCNICNTHYIVKPNDIFNNLESGTCLSLESWKRHYQCYHEFEYEVILAAGR